MTSPRTLRFPRMTALAAGLAMAFLGPDISVAVPPPVNNCNDSGPGSLRNAVVNAANGDTILLSGSCTPITLTSAIATLPGVNDLTLNGPGANALEISGGQAGRIFDHTGTGTLSISGVTLTLGLVITTSGDAKGGCIASLGNVHLTDSVVTGCSAVANTGANYALGGGVYAAGEVALVRSTISGNVTLAVTQGKNSNGGGVFARNGLSADFSTLSNNQSNPTGSIYAGGGGACIYDGAVAINNSTISGNQAGVAAGLYLRGLTSITNSTIANNAAAHHVGGLKFRRNSNAEVSISNSTIAFNTAGDAQTAIDLFAAGLDIEHEEQSGSININSTLLANNKAAGTASDFSHIALLNRTMISQPFSGSHNLIYAQNFNLKVPMDTASVCPRLQRLAPHGGPTQTVALRSGSFAINQGIDSNMPPLTFDQRGLGFTRTFNAVDIGAYERQPNEQDDALFFSSFESGCDE